MNRENNKKTALGIADRERLRYEKATRAFFMFLSYHTFVFIARLFKLVSGGAE